MSVDMKHCVHNLDFQDAGGTNQGLGQRRVIYPTNQPISIPLGRIMGLGTKGTSAPARGLKSRGLELIVSSDEATIGWD